MKKNIGISNSTLPHYLAELRVKAALTKADLAEKAGVTPRTIDDLEKGRRDRVQEKTLKLLASALGIPFEDFLDQCRIRPKQDMHTNAQAQTGLDALNANGTDTAPRAAGSRARTNRKAAYAIAAGAVICAALLGVWRLAVSNPEIRISGNKITATDRFFGFKLWEFNHLSRIASENLSDSEPARWPGKPWIVYGLTAQASDCGTVFVRNRSTGKPVWEKTPDKAALAAVFGDDMMDQGGFNARSFHFMDFNHDDRPELLVLYIHGKWYPACIRIFGEDGRTVGSYYHHGHINCVHVDDIDLDGTDELLLAGTNNAPGSIGATLILLDEKHCGGGFVYASDRAPAEAGTDANASADRDDATCVLEDSSLVRVVFPNLEPAYMQLLGLERLRADQIKTFTDHDGRRMITVDIGHGKNHAILITLNSLLRPLSVQLSDEFRVMMRSWPEELQPPDSYFDEWLRRARRYEMGRLVE